MDYYSVNRLARLRRAVEEVEHLLSVSPLQELAWSVKSPEPTWQKTCLMLRPHRDYSAILHTIDLHVNDYPENTWLRCARALLLFGIDYFSAARQDLEYALYLNPRHVEAKLLLGESWYHSGQFDRAFKIISHVLKNNPTHIRANMARITICQALARRTSDLDRQTMYYNLALSDLDLLMSISPNREIETLRHTLERKISKRS